MEKEIMKVPEVARILGCSEQKVREHIRRGIWKFGECVPASKKWYKIRTNLNIYRRKFEKFIGRDS